jgi:hypothetical protein
VSTMRTEVASLVDAGRSLEDIDAKVLETSSLSDQERAELWLYAWGRRYRNTRRRGLDPRPRVPDLPLR